ncbi:glycosyltransferase [Marinilabiliaceae bacterium JC017]|nr:glycosyltransferase [Marinilabiliaceae bacterium JC017]
MEYLQIFLKIVGLGLFSYLLLSASYFFFFSISGMFYREKREKASVYRNIAVFIPAYKEDGVIVEVARKALGQNYPSDHFEIIVIADSLRKETLDDLIKLPIRVVEVSFEKSTKAKALNRALSLIDDSFDIVVVLDADNIMEDRFLEKVNQAFQSGDVIQGHRTALNQNNHLAVLDAISEEVNNHVFRKGHRAMGLSAALIGSGMAFDYTCFKQKMKAIRAIGGFDKELELAILADQKTIKYLDQAMVYDEKVHRADAFIGQRRRWLAAQIFYFIKGIRKGVSQLVLNGNVDLFDKIIQMVLAPRIILLGVLAVVSGVLGILSAIYPLGTWTEWIIPQPFYWYLMLSMVLTGFLFSIPSRFYNRQTGKALLYLPKAFGLMVLALLKIKGANKRFIHTSHGLTDQVSSG